MISTKELEIKCGKKNFQTFCSISTILSLQNQTYNNYSTQIFIVVIFCQSGDKSDSFAIECFFKPLEA